VQKSRARRQIRDLPRLIEQILLALADGIHRSSARFIMRVSSAKPDSFFEPFTTKYTKHTKIGRPEPHPLILVFLIRDLKSFPGIEVFISCDSCFSWYLRLSRLVREKSV
jgi:hypothetical protein